MIDDRLRAIREANQKRQEQAQQQQRTEAMQQSNAYNQQAIFDAFQSMVEALQGEKTKSEATSMSVLKIVEGVPADSDLTRVVDWISPYISNAVTE